jgi:class 3 adenylate cyclase
MVLVTLPFSGTADANAPMWSRLVLLAAGQLVNVAIVISVVRYDLFDVDRLLGATVSYNLLAVVVVGGGLLFVPTVTNAMTTRLGVDPTFGRTGITVVLAIVLIAAERKLRPLVERMIFKERYALEQAMKDLPEKFATVGRADALWKLTADELVENLRPANCVVFVSAGAAFVPVVNRGDVLAPQLAAGSPAVEWVRSAPTARLVGASGVRRDYPVAQATFRELGTQVVLPVTRNGALEVFVCIGEKRSGDIYTQTDLTLLTAVARTLSMHMLRFDEAELLERAQAMQAKMRRYVPGAVADAIARGTDLETGEREVSVLFVDLRGYTAYADGRETSAIFSTVNHYTEIVSTIVNSCGGVVVEFNGDGMMAVFGAPRPLPAKEQAALEAARRLVHEVPLMARESPDAPAMTVGVGIATGLAFVGNIEAADRTIWSAIGNTTNLAARLQSMTREMGVSLLADSTTAGRAKDAADGLVEHRGVTIRGRKDYETVFALPLTAPATLPSHTVPA